MPAGRNATSLDSSHQIWTSKASEAANGLHIRALVLRKPSPTPSKGLMSSSPTAIIAGSV
jgi:hypothetical protein